MTTTEDRSTTSTFRGTSEVGAPRLAGLPGVTRDEAVPVEVSEIERYDTDDSRLTAAGIRLTLRRDGDGGPDDAGRWQLDLPDGDAVEVLSVPLPPGAGAVPAVPAELDELVHGVSRDRALRAAGRVRTVRTATRLLAARGRLLATVVHDEVTLATLGRSTEVQGWSEVALLPAVADATLLAALVERVVESGMHPAAPAGEAELDRLLRPVVRRRPVTRAGTAGRAVHDYLSVQVGRLAAEDLRVRRGEPDAVHQLRIAARRLRSALRSFRPLLDRDRTDPLVDSLRALARELAPARDAEVLRERITAGLDALPPALLLGPVQAQVTRHFARAEAEAYAAVLSALDGGSYIALRRGLDDLVERPPLTGRASAKAAKALPPLVARCVGRLDRTMDAALAGDDVAIHTARKAAKQLRYATEVARPVAGKPAVRFANGLKGVQRALGEHQDTVVARETLRELGARAENGFSFGVLLGQDAARAAVIEAELEPTWGAMRSKKLRRWLS